MDLVNTKIFENKEQGSKILEELNLNSNIRPENLKIEDFANITNMLKAAAMTYVASLASTILNLLRLIFIYQDRD